MEMKRFDSFTRRLSGAGSSRRQALQLLGTMLFGGVLTGVAARFGLTEGEAKAKRHKAKRKQKRAPQAERKAHGQLQAEGKRKEEGQEEAAATATGVQRLQRVSDVQERDVRARPGVGAGALSGQWRRLRLLPGRGVRSVGGAAVPGRGLSAQGPVLSRRRRQAMHRPRTPERVLLRGQECLLPRHGAQVRQRLLPAPGGVLPGTKAVQSLIMRGQERVLPGRDAVRQWLVRPRGPVLRRETPLWRCLLRGGRDVPRGPGRTSLDLALLPQRAERQRALLRREQDGLRAGAREASIRKVLLLRRDRVLRRRLLLPTGHSRVLQRQLSAQEPGSLGSLRRPLHAERLLPVLQRRRQLLQGCRLLPEPLLRARLPLLR